jgi:putative ABC transport system permease protein
MLGRKRPLDDFATEIEAHLQLEADRLRAEGLSAGEARAAAHRAFGNVTRARERFYESGRWLWWDRLWQDVRYGARMLRKSPGFTAVAVLTIALGIGATTAIFSVVDATLLHPLRYPHPEQLVSVEDDLPGAGALDVGLSQPELHDLQHSGIFTYVSPAWLDDNNLTGSCQPARVRLSIVAPSYFALLGVEPQLGRAFDPKYDAPGFIQEALISDGFWKRGFGRDPHVLDRSVRLDTDLYRIVGVMPAGFHPPGRTTDERNVEVWAATSFYGPPLPDRPPRNRRNIPGAIARLEPGLTLAAAQARVDALVASLQKQYPADDPLRNAWRVRLVPLKQTVVGDVRQSLILLLGAVALVLVIGCLNVANLLLVRASARGREIVVRQALGAGRMRLIRQLLTESLCLSLLGGMAGLAILWSVKGFLLRLVPEGLPRLDEVSINWTVLLCGLGASLVAGAIFGLAPALHAGRLDLTRTLKQEGRGATGSGEQARTRRVLVVAELALALVLAIAASLLVHSFWNLLNARLGFDPRKVMAVRTRLPYPNDVKIDLYGTPQQEAPFLREVLRRGRSLRGVEEAAIGDSASIPLNHGRRDLNLVAFSIAGREVRSDQPTMVERSSVTPEYFHLLRITLLRGRLFTAMDDERAPAVAVINEAFARTYWPDENPLGKRFKQARADAPWMITVVGVIANARTESLADASVPQVYLDLYQSKEKHLAIFLRGNLDAAAVPDQLRRQVQAVDPTIPVYEAQTLDEALSASLSERRFAMAMVGLFALTALLLAGLGIFGVLSYVVSERTHEIGIRLALGAHRQNILRLVLGQGLTLAVVGAAVGLAGALAAGHLMTGLLYGVSATDPVIFAGVAVLLIGVALLACYLPARRAIDVDPMVALRYE